MPMKTFRKIFTFFLLFLLCTAFGFGQISRVKTDLAKAKNNIIENTDKSSWVGGDCASTTWWTGAIDANPYGSEIYIMGSEFVPLNKTITKVRFFHQNGIVNFQGGTSVNFTNTSYTIEIYQNPDFSSSNYNYYSGTYYLYSAGTLMPYYTQTVNLTSEPNGTYELELDHPYTYTGTPFLVGVKFNNGKGAAKLSSTGNSANKNKFFMLYYDNDPNLMCKVITDSEFSPGYLSIGIELFVDDGIPYMPTCDLEIDFLDPATDDFFPSNNITIGATDPVKFDLGVWNNGPDAANGNFTYSATVATNTVTSGSVNVNVPSGSGSYLNNVLNPPIELSVANMNAWGLTEFDITATVSLSNITDPVSNNNTATLHVIRNIPAITQPQYTPANGSSNIPIATGTSSLPGSLKATFSNNITLVNQSLITISPSCGTISASLSAGNTLIINHTNQLAYGTNYTVTIAAGTLLGQTTSYSWSFSTENQIPILNSWLPTGINVAISTVITATFDIPISSGAAYSNIQLVETINPLNSVAISNNITNNVLTITPNSPLNYDTEYTVIIPNNAIANFGYKSWDFTTLPAQVITPPIAQQFMPTDGAIGVSITTAIYVMFNQTITEGANLLSSITLTSINGTETTTANINGSILTITHNQLAYNTLYTVTIPANAIENYTGTSWSFKTLAEPIITPTILQKNPIGNNVALNASVWVEFDNNITGSNLSNIIIMDQYSNTIPCSPSINGAMLTILNQGTFNYNTTYTVNIPTGVIDNFNGINWQFTTILEPTPETPQPILPYTPADAANNVPITTEIFVTFDMPITNGSEISNVTLSSIEHGMETNVTANTNGSKIIISHDILQYNSNYTVTIPANAVNNYSSTIIWSFKTVESYNVPIIEISEFDIYPNPAKYEVQIINSNLKNGDNIIIYDIFGKIIRNITIENNRLPIINISDLSSGVYFVKLEQNGQVKTKKLIIN